jgi:hypothetical protein
MLTLKVWAKGPDRRGPEGNGVERSGVDRSGWERIGKACSDFLTGVGTHAHIVRCE